MTRVLVVDDEPQIVRALRINLRARRYDVDTAADGTSALRAASHHHPDLVVLDLGLPDMEGADVIRGLRGWTSVPIIVLSGRAGSRDKGSTPSTRAPTTTSPSPSASTNFSPASAPSPAGSNRPERPRPW
jgi:CheY-like chemotaxis protein